MNGTGARPAVHPTGHPAKPPGGLLFPMASIAEFERRAAACDRIIRNRAAKVSEAMRQEAPATLAQPGFAPARDVTLQTPMPVPFLPFAEAASDRRYRY